MKKIRILCVGNNKDSYIAQGLSVFEKKLKRYCKLQQHIIKEANYGFGSQDRWLEEEGSRLSKLTSPGNLTIICDEKGQSFTSAALAREFVRYANQGYSQFDFIVGGAFGLSDPLKQSADILLSFSPMTTTHQLFRLLLLEQIYRAYTIINGEKYHHD